MSAVLASPLPSSPPLSASVCCLTALLALTSPGFGLEIGILFLLRSFSLFPVPHTFSRNDTLYAIHDAVGCHSFEHPVTHFSPTSHASSVHSESHSSICCRDAMSLTDLSLPITPSLINFTPSSPRPCNIHVLLRRLCSPGAALVSIANCSPPHPPARASTLDFRLFLIVHALLNQINCARR